MEIIQWVGCASRSAANFDFYTGSWFAHKFYKGEKLPFELLAPPSAAEEAAMLSGGKANVPITPDVAYTGKG